MESSSSRVNSGAKWAILFEGKVVEIPSIVIEEIQANPTQVLGWFNHKLCKAWKWIFPLTPLSMKTGCLPLTNSTWGLMENPWWSHLSDTPELEEVRRIVWETIPRIHLAPMLCEVEPKLSLTARRMLENQPIATAFMGNKHALKILQMF